MTAYCEEGISITGYEGPKDGVNVSFDQHERQN